MNRISPQRFGFQPGFSLVELLVVIAILCVLLVSGVQVFSQISRTGQANTNLLAVDSILERARAYAIAKNTYTWVVFDKLASTPGNPIQMAAFASSDGTSTSASIAVGSAGGPVLVDKVQPLENCQLSETVPATSSVLNKLPSGGASPLGQSPTFQYRVRGTDLTFRYHVMFTPSGETRVGTALPDSVRLVLIPLIGGSAPDESGLGVIQIAGLTGRVKIYRP